MIVVFRTDAKSQIGTGHFIRCLTFADVLCKSGAEVFFICHDLPAHLGAMLAERGIPLLQLTGDSPVPPADDLMHSHWLWTDQVHDAQASLQALGDDVRDWIIVDHYAIDYRWETLMRKAAKRIMVIDDLADRRHDCDILLDQNYYHDMNKRYLGKLSENCRLLLGPRYALLREEFHELRKQIKPRDGKVRRILVFFGGVDAGNYTGLAICALMGLGVKNIAVDVVIGKQHPCRIDIEQACIEAGFSCHVQTSRMAELMATSDLAIGAGGTATWERCCLGLPTFSLCTAENQRRVISDAAEIGLLYAPSHDDDLVGLLRRHIAGLLENAPVLKLLSNTAMDAVDGAGALRIMSEFDSSEMQTNAGKVSVRLGADDDAVVVWPWRNSDSTRRYSFDPSPVRLDQHVEWWNRTLADSQCSLLIGLLEGIAFGVLRFDFDTSETAVISIYLDPAKTGKGMGQALLREGLSWLKENHLKTKIVSAEILPENPASLRVFQSAGFVEQHRSLIYRV